MFDIRAKRKEAKLTQDDLAKKVGINRATLSKYENGQIEPPFSQLVKIADALQVPVYELMGYSLKHDTPENRAIADAGLRAAFGKGGAADVSEWEEVPFDRVHADQQAHLESRMKQAFSALNEVGQKVACERVEELAKIDDYKRTEPPETLSADGEYTDTTQKEKPSEGAETPTGGNNES